MGYTGTMFLATILLSPVALIGGRVLLWLAHKARLIPRGTAGIVGYLLIICAGYGFLYLGMTLNHLVLWPAHLQHEYLGERVGGPRSLVHFDMGGFQDPYAEWRYLLSDAEINTLRQRCTWSEFPHGYRRCALYGGMDERWFAEVSLEGNELRMIDGLH